MFGFALLTAAHLAAAPIRAEPVADQPRAWFPNGLRAINLGKAPVVASECGRCHPAHYRDWQSSQHAQAWVDPIFQREYNDRPMDWCVNCHAPLREQVAQVHAGGGALANEGVTCDACHTHNGRLVSRTRAPNSPHDTLVDTHFGGPEFCGGCHQFNFPLERVVHGRPEVIGYTALPMQDTIAQHAAGPYARSECLTCHTSGEAGHRFPGGHDRSMLERALEISVCRIGKKIAVSLHNRGAGHHLPTGDVHRHLVARLWSSSAPERLVEQVFGREFEALESGGKRLRHDRRIPAGQSKSFTAELGSLGAQPSEPISLEVRMVWTIDEYPFRGRELPVPTAMTIHESEIQWADLRRCGAER